MKRTLVVVHDIAEMVSAAIVSFTHAHRVVGEVDIAVIAFEGLAMVQLKKAEHLQKSEDKLAHCVDSGMENTYTLAL